MFRDVIMNQKINVFRRLLDLKKNKVLLTNRLPSRIAIFQQAGQFHELIN